MGARVIVPSSLNEWTSAEGFSQSTGFLNDGRSSEAHDVSVVAGRFDGSEAAGEVNTYPKNPSGMPLAEFTVRDSRTRLPPSATWDFETPAYDADFDDAYVFIRHARAQ